MNSKTKKRVILTSEQETALKHAEIKQGEVTRKDHRGTPIPVTDPTSNEINYEKKD